MLFQMTMQNIGIPMSAIIFLMLLCFGIIIFLTVFWVLMIIDCATRKRFSDGERVAWILVLVFLHFIGATIYYFAVKRK